MKRRNGQPTSNCDLVCRYRDDLESRKRKQENTPIGKFSLARCREKKPGAEIYLRVAFSTHLRR